VRHLLRHALPASGLHHAAGVLARTLLRLAAAEHLLRSAAPVVDFLLTVALVVALELLWGALRSRWAGARR
jgi:hypothetical protein